VAGSLFGIVTVRKHHINNASGRFAERQHLRRCELGDFDAGVSGTVTVTGGSSLSQWSIYGAARLGWDELWLFGWHYTHQRRAFRFISTSPATSRLASIAGFSASRVHGSFSGGFHVWASDVSGGYAFIDTKGTGVWDPVGSAGAGGFRRQLHLRAPESGRLGRDSSGAFAIRGPQWHGRLGSADGAARSRRSRRRPADGSPRRFESSDADAAEPSRRSEPAAICGVPKRPAGRPTRHRKVWRHHGDRRRDPGMAHGHGLRNKRGRSISADKSRHHGTGRRGQTVFLDLNHDGKLDPGDPYVTADHTGSTLCPNFDPVNTLGLLGRTTRTETARSGPSEGTSLCDGRNRQEHGLT